MNVIAADSGGQAQEQLLAVKRARVSSMLGKGRLFTDEEADEILASPAGLHIEQMLTYSAVGTPPEVRKYVEGFVRHADADELITVHHAATPAARLRSVEVLADAVPHAS